MNLSHINEICLHLGESRENYLNSVTPPIFQTSNFAFKSVQDLQKAMTGGIDSYVYTRGNNPTTEILRKKLAALENTEDALVFSSGMAALSAAITSCVSSGDHVVCIDKPYSWTSTLLSKWLGRFNVTVTYVRGETAEDYKKAMQPNTKLFVLESPNSWTFETQDIKGIATLAKAHGIKTVIDSTYSTPLHLNPSDLGIDFTMHTASKYLGGHSDIVAGVLCGSKKLISEIFFSEFMTLGGNLSPFDSWLMIRSLRTLPIRIEQIQKNTHAVLEFLKTQDWVESIITPKDGPVFGLFSITVRTNDTKNIEKFCDNLKYFLMAVSWGGHESLILPSIMFANSILPKNLLRLYVGLDSADYLIDDLKKASAYL